MEVPFSYVRWMIGGTYPISRSHPPLQKRDGNIVEVNSDPIQCLVYGTDQIWAAFKALQKLGPFVIKEPISVIAANTNRCNLGLVKLITALLDRHPLSVERYKRDNYTLQVTSEVGTFHEVLNYVTRDNRAYTTREFEYDYEEEVEDADYVVFPEGCELTTEIPRISDHPMTYSLEVISGISPFFLWHPGLSWFLRGVARDASRRQYDGAIREIINYTDLKELLTAWIEFKAFVEGNVYSDIFGYKSSLCSLIDTVIVNGGWTTFGNSFTKNWRLDSHHIVNHGVDLHSWETAVNRTIFDLKNANKEIITIAAENIDEVAERIQTNVGINIAEKHIPETLACK